MEKVEQKRLENFGKKKSFKQKLYKFKKQSLIKSKNRQKTKQN